MTHSDYPSRILVRDTAADEKILRSKTPHFDFKKLAQRELRELIQHMRGVMRAAKGVGLSANQIGLPYRLFVAEVPVDHGRTKFYAVLNPELTELPKKKTMMEEGCLSVPGMYGEIQRAERVVLRGEDLNQKPLKIKAWGLLAQVFQHEVGHLNGKLFSDEAKTLYPVPTTARLKEREHEVGVALSQKD